MGRSEIEAGGGSDDRQWLNSSSPWISEPQAPINCQVYIRGWTMSHVILGGVAGFRARPPLFLRDWITNWDEYNFAAAK
jgi:hypothetical protein